MNEFSLTNFQNRLTTALSDPDVSSDSFVSILLDDDPWLIDLTHIKEASVPHHISKSFGAPAWAVGISNFHGEIWSIIDMRQLLKGQSTINPNLGWVTLLRSVSNHQIALLWSEIVEISSKQEYDVHPINKNLINEKSQTLLKSQYKDKNNKIWNELDVEKIAGENGLISLWHRNINKIKSSSSKIKDMEWVNEQK